MRIAFIICYTLMFIAIMALPVYLVVWVDLSRCWFFTLIANALMVLLFPELLIIATKEKR